MTFRIGTSGWHYAHWVGPLYPPGLPQDKMLSYYSAEFETVEVNSSFYRLPSIKALIAWRESTPHSFTFTFKASRYVTHMKKLRGTEDALANLLDRARTLAPKLGPILFQLPPRWRVDIELLRGFLAQIPEPIQAAFEFRDPSWMVDDVYDVLKESGLGFCIYDLSGSTAPLVVTSDLVYLRLHGPDGPYRGLYDTGTLSSWAERITAWHKEGKNVFCYFDNDEGGFAVRNARELKALLAI